MRGRQAMERAEILRDFHPEDSGHGQGRCHEGASGGEDHGGCLRRCGGNKHAKNLKVLSLQRGLTIEL